MASVGIIDTMDFWTPIIVGLVIAAVSAINVFLINRFGSLEYEDIDRDIADVQRRINSVLRVFLRMSPELPALIMPKISDDKVITELDAHMELPTGVKVTVGFADLGNRPGQIRQTGLNSYAIMVHHKYAHDRAVTLGVLAHEGAHIWGEQVLRPSLGRDIPERTVDVTAVMRGGGFVMMSAMHQVASHEQEGVSVRNTRLGYLSLVELGYAFAVYCRLARVDARDFLPHLPAISRQGYKHGNADLRRKPYCLQLSRTSLTIKCNYCFQLFRIPRKNGRRVVATCPTCRHEFSSSPTFLSSRFFSSLFLRDCQPM